MSLCVSLCVCLIYLCISEPLCTFVYMYMYVCSVDVCLSVCLVCLCICEPLCIFVCLHLCVCMCVPVFVHVFVSACPLCMSVYLGICLCLCVGLTVLVEDFMCWKEHP